MPVFSLVLNWSIGQAGKPANPKYPPVIKLEGSNGEWILLKNIAHIFEIFKE